MMEPLGELEAWRVPLDAAEDWRRRHGVVAIYLNDIALGVRLDIPDDWWNTISCEHWSREETWQDEPIRRVVDGAIERIGGGLRTLLQEIWRADLVRPVLAVCSLREGAPQRFGDRIRRLAWDDGWHRADFALRVVDSPGGANELLLTLMGDTMGALDDEAQEVRSGAEDVRELLTQREESLRYEQADPAKSEVAEREGRVVAALLSEIKRATDAREPPDLAAKLQAWLADERRKG